MNAWTTAGTVCGVFYGVSIAQAVMGNMVVAAAFAACGTLAGLVAVVAAWLIDAPN